MASLIILDCQTNNVTALFWRTQFRHEKPEIGRWSENPVRTKTLKIIRPIPVLPVKISDY